MSTTTATSATSERAARHRVCAIVPAFNAAETLPAVLEGVARWGIATIVVDDGSTDGTAALLSAWRDGAERDQTRIVMTLALNGGKARALRDGFARSIELGFDAAITIDADGQHDPSDGASLLAHHGQCERETLICGCRDAGTPGYPLRNLAGRRLNDLAIRAQTGVAVRDSPCGLRVYPLRAVREIQCISGRFAWEEEFITRALWAGFAYSSQPIRCIYVVDGRRRSHYRFRRDWPEGIAVNLWLLAVAALPPRPRRGVAIQLARQFAGSISPARMRDHLIGDSPARLHGAATLAVSAASASAWGVASTQVAVVTTALGAWLVVRLHGSLLLAVMAGASVQLIPGILGRAVYASALLVAIAAMALQRRAP